MEDKKSIARKRHLFRTIDHIDDDDENVEESVYQKKLKLEDLRESGARKTTVDGRGQVGSRRKRNVSPKLFNHSQAPQGLIRRATEPTASSFWSHGKAELLKSEHSTHQVTSRVPNLVHANTSPAATAVYHPPLEGGTPLPLLAAGKRKRPYQVALAKEHDRWFAGCVCFFFPASDIDKVRRFFITKVIERGAIWTRAWHPLVTHIIMDNGLSKEDLLKHTELNATPTKAIVVDHTYLTACLENKNLVNPSYYQGQVKGFESIPEAKPSPQGPSTVESDRSLPVKAAKSRGMVGNELISESTLSRASNASEEARLQLNPSESRSPAAAAPIQPKPKTSANALDEAIAEARGTAVLMMDSEDEEHSRPTPSRSAGANADSEGLEENEDPRPTTESSKIDVPTWQQKFSCMQAPTTKQGQAGNPNAAVIDILEQMSKYYDSTNDTWRTIAYRKAISALKEHPVEVTSAAQATLIPGIGSRLAAKIEEIKWTSRLRRLDNALLEPTDKALKLFLGIYGVGPALAGSWAQKGYRSLADVETHNVPLTENQKLGIAHYDDFATRIPRAEVERHGAIVSKAVHAIDPAFQVVIGGSYRRGAATSGDIDLVITHPTNKISDTRTTILDTLVPQLFASNFLVAGLATTSRDDGTKWHGACQLPTPHTSKAISEAPSCKPNPWRRIDFLLVPDDELGAAMLYFTGNDVFNRSMRLLAEKKGWRLNQRGLYKAVMRGREQKQLNEGEKIAGRDEREIFAKLGVPWREVDERDC